MLEAMRADEKGVPLVCWKQGRLLIGNLQPRSARLFDRSLPPARKSADTAVEFGIGPRPDDCIGRRYRDGKREIRRRWCRNGG